MCYVPCSPADAPRGHSAQHRPPHPLPRPGVCPGICCGLYPASLQPRGPVSSPVLGELWHSGWLPRPGGRCGHLQLCEGTTPSSGGRSSCQGSRRSRRRPPSRFPCRRAPHECGPDARPAIAVGAVPRQHAAAQRHVATHAERGLLSWRPAGSACTCSCTGAAAATTFEGGRGPGTACTHPLRPHPSRVLGTCNLHRRSSPAAAAVQEEGSSRRHSIWRESGRRRRRCGSIASCSRVGSTAAAAGGRGRWGSSAAWQQSARG
jgi:hypothetical protein